MLALQTAQAGSKRTVSWIEDHPALVTLAVLLLVVSGPLVQYTRATVDAVALGLDEFHRGNWDKASAQVGLGLGMYAWLPEGWRSSEDRLHWADATVVSAALRTTLPSPSSKSIKDELGQAINLYDRVRTDPKHSPEALGALSALEPQLTDMQRKQLHQDVGNLATSQRLRLYRKQLETYFEIGDLDGFRKVEQLAAPLAGPERTESSVIVRVEPGPTAVTDIAFNAPGATIDRSTSTGFYTVRMVSPQPFTMGEVTWIEGGHPRSALIRMTPATSDLTVTATRRSPMLLLGVQERLQVLEVKTEPSSPDIQELVRLNAIALQSINANLQGRLCWTGTLLGKDGAAAVSPACEAAISVATATSAASLDLLGLNRVLSGNAEGARAAWDTASRSTNQGTNRQNATARRATWLTNLDGGADPDPQTLDQVRREPTFNFTPPVTPPVTPTVTPPVGT